MKKRYTSLVTRSQALFAFEQALRIASSAEPLLPTKREKTKQKSTSKMPSWLAKQIADEASKLSNPKICLPQTPPKSHTQ